MKFESLWSSKTSLGFLQILVWFRHLVNTMGVISVHSACVSHKPGCSCSICGEAALSWWLWWHLSALSLFCSQRWQGEDCPGSEELAETGALRRCGRWGGAGSAPQMGKLSCGTWAELPGAIQGSPLLCLY